MKIVAILHYGVSLISLQVATRVLNFLNILIFYFREICDIIYLSIIQLLFTKESIKVLQALFFTTITVKFYKCNYNQITKNTTYIKSGCNNNHFTYLHSQPSTIVIFLTELELCFTNINFTKRQLDELIGQVRYIYFLRSKCNWQ